jgi:hypothetical protein
MGQGHGVEGCIKNANLRAVGISITVDQLGSWRAIGIELVDEVLEVSACLLI